MDRTTPNQTIPPAGRADLSDLSDEQWLERLRKADQPVALGRLGPYELLAEVSRGAQGVVFRARQPNTERVIALKRLIAGTYATPASRARFEREIRTELALRHPNIVTVYGVEIVDGQPLLAMEWIDGVPVDRYVQQSPAVPGRVTPREDTRARLELFLKIADAVHHAHQRGVIHRDLKPSNILVDAAGEPHVLDFGLAKFTSPRAAPVEGGRAGEADDSDLARLTDTQGFLGTPAYAAPEQVRGEHAAVDVRTDVYALGVILYQMLTGRLPFPADGNLVALLDAIRQTEPLPPSRIIGEHGPLARPLRRAGPLWWLRGLRGVFTGRRPMLPATGQRPMLPIDAEIDALVLKALAKEPDARYPSVDAFAADVRRYLAGEPIEAQRASTWYVLRKALRRHRGAVAAAAAFLILLAGGTVVSTVLWQRAERESAATRDEAQKAAQISDFLQKMLASLNPERVEGRDISLLVETLDSASTRLETELPNRREVRADLYMTIARTYRDLGEFERAEKAVRAAVTIRRQLFKGDSPALAESLHFLVVVRFNRGLPHNAEMKALATEALQIRRRLFGEDHPAYAESLDWWTRVHGWELWHKEPSEAERLFRQVLEVRRKWLAPDDPEIANTLMLVGECRAHQGQYAEAARYLGETFDIRRRRLGETNRLTVAAEAELGVCLVKAGQPAAGLAHARHAVDVGREALPADHPDLAVALHVLGWALLQAGDAAEAESPLREALAIKEKHYESGHWRIAKTQSTLGECLSLQGRYEEAEALLLPSFAVLRTLSADDDDARDAQRRVIEFYEAWGKPENAEPFRAPLPPLPVIDGPEISLPDALQ